ncbi:PREDICTED: uncharacterized protein LOC108370686 [Rhagoletis zephyria]|uniref:uncharacterized protein LOC108370686 n=1 Tax=Rhagoletis zephyria TaxID=28612 RepID=UPI0008117DC9|nr:PREDICTED: uncharacterized protein LOC108370686 [Rhagoletis zephyria]
MKVLNVFKLCMICCLEPMFLAILLLPLSNAITVNNTNNAITKYWLLPTKTTSNITLSTHAESNCPSSTAATILTVWNVYFTLCINNHDARNSISYRNVESHFRRQNESEIVRESEGNIESWSLEQQWKRKERTKGSNAKSNRGVAGVINQHRSDDIFEITLCMLLAIFVEVIPLTLRYVRKRTVLFWRWLLLLCCCSYWSISRKLFQRQRLRNQRAVALNCVCELIKLATLKLKKRQDHIPKLPYAIRQNQLTIFAVLTGKMFALFVQGATTPSTEMTISSDAGTACTTTGRLILLSGVPTATTAIIAQNFKKTCHNFLLTTLLMDPVTLTFNTPFLTDHVLYILVPQENRLFHNQLAFSAVICEQVKTLHLYYACQYFNGIDSSKKQQENYSVGGLKICSDCNRSHSHQKYRMILIFQPLFDIANTIIETYDNNYVKMHNNSRYLKPSKPNMVKLNKRRTKSSSISKLEHEIFRGRDEAVVERKKTKYGKLMRQNPRLHDLLTSTSAKSSAKLTKSTMSTNQKRPANLGIPINAKNKSAPAQEDQNRKGKNTDWNECMHAIMKFDLCCCFWCFCCYRRCNCISGRNSSDDCWCTWYWCWQRHYRQHAFNYPHCIYCYYNCCRYYCFYRCYCCCCLAKLHSTSITCPYCHVATRLNNQPSKLKKHPRAGKMAQKQQPSQNPAKKQKVPQQLEDFRNFLPPQGLTSTTCLCFECPVWFSCRSLHCYQNAHCFNSTKDVTTLTKTATKLNGEILFSKKTKFMRFARCSAKHLSKYIFHQLIHMAEYFYRYIIAALRVKISVPRSRAIVIKVSREQKQQQQQQQMVSIANDQQLKMNNLCKLFCNNWKRHRRRRRRRRRRRINIQEQQQQQSITLQQQHMSSEKDTLFHITNHRFGIWDLNACKTIPTNAPSVHFILSKAAAGSILAGSVLAGMRLANTKIIALSDRTRKDMMSPAPTPALITSSTFTASANTARVGRNRPRPNLVWLFIGLVWFEGPKYVNCNINGSSQSQQPSTRAQTQTQTQTVAHTTTQAPLQPLTVLSHQQQRQTQPPQIVSNLPLLTTNHKPISKSPVSHSQKATEDVFDDVSTSLKSKIKHGKNSNASGKSIRSGNCLSSRKRASIMAATTNEKQTGTSNTDSILPIDHTGYEWLEAEVEYDFLEEEAHDTLSDRVRLESIKRQILTKLGLKHRPNVSHPLPKQFIWDTIYRADGIRRVVSEFDFNENASQQWEIRAKAAATGLTKLPLRLERYQKDDEAVNGGIIHNSNDGPLDIHIGKMNHSSHYSNNNETEAYLDAENLDEYNLRQEHYGMSKDANRYESEDFVGDTQEIITFAEKGRMYKQHRLVEFSPRTNGVPNQKLFVRKAEIHIRIDKAAIRGTENKNKKSFGCSGKKTKLKLWIFQFMENNTTKKGCEQSPQLCASFNVDTINLGWQKFDITSTIRNWYARVPMEKLRLLIDCTGCGKYVLHLFDLPTDISKQKQPFEHQHQKYHSMNRNDLVAQWTRQRSGLNNAIKISKESNAIQRALQDRPLTEHASLDCNSIFGCNVQRNATAIINGYKVKKIQTQFLQQYPLEGNRQHRANRIQRQQKNTKNRRQNRLKHQDAQHLQRQTDMELQMPKSQEPNPNRPFLVLRTETKRYRRVRRRAIDCVGAIHGQCCKESFYVSFKALGWDDWIIAPRGYFANYCRGDCTGPFRTPDTFQTFHAHFIEEYRKIGLLNGMQPCCAPVKFSSMSLIYYGDDGIIKRDLPKMVVDECGCP